MPKTGKSPALARRIAISLTRNVATSAKLTTIALDAAKDGSAPDENTDGLEADAIIELRDDRWAGIEVKLGENKVEEANGLGWKEGTPPDSTFIGKEETTRRNYAARR